jgi:hypothetical protein
MLMYPDRQKFELIRARWEAAQQSEEELADMVGRRISQQPASGDYPSNGGSKFRRTLSHGLAFISNPLSQRKTTPGRLQNLPPTATEAAANASTHHDAPISPSPTRKPTSVKRPNANADSATALEAPTKRANSEKSLELDATPKALPRSFTSSQLPRPARAESDASVSDTEKTIKIIPSAVVPDPKLHAMPSKIPTPSPPLSERRVSSPRQYLQTSRQGNHVAASYTFARNSATSPAKAALRSRTTSSLVKAANSPRPANYMAPTRVGYKKPEATQDLVLQENIPVNKRITQRRSQQQEKPMRRESLAMPPMTTNRRSFVQNNALAHRSKQTNQGTPLAEKKQFNSNPVQQTPSSARRGQAKEQAAHGQGHTPITNSGTIAQPRLMGPQNPATPPLLPAETARPALPRSDTDKDLQRKTLGTPNGLGGIWRSSRALAAANHEVRKLPRSSTFHNFGTSWKSAPPIPPIPEQYRDRSLSNFFRFKSSCTSMPSDAASCESIPEGETDSGSQPNEPMTPSHNGPASMKLSDSCTNLSPPPNLLAAGLPSTGPQSSVTSNENERPWSISDKHYEDSTDIESWLQVRDYMPPLYWAGRFQSRYDQWRTEAMMVHLDPERPKEGQLAKCTLDQEKLAACFVLAQLRDLCLTESAADSLWVCDRNLFLSRKLGH